MKYDDYVEAFGNYYTDLKKVCDTKRAKDELESLALKRKISLLELEESGIFWIENNTQMILPQHVKNLKTLGVISATNNMPIFRERFVIPIKDQSKNVINFVGYSPTSEERYVYGTGEWYDRGEMFYGLENMDIAYEKGWAILLEGISDVWALRQFGIKNVLGNCGTRFGSTKERQCKRLSRALIIIPDRDRAGLNLESKITLDKKVSLFVPIQFKDFAETVEKTSEERCMEIIESIKEVINWVENNASSIGKLNEDVNL